MPKHNSENERIKRMYFTHLKAARGLSEASIDAVAKAIHRFESSTGFRSLKKFHVEQAIAFRRRLDEAVSEREGKPLSKATVLQTLNALRGARRLIRSARPTCRRRYSRRARPAPALRGLS
jgi:site-specific recombinase XerD